MESGSDDDFQSVNGDVPPSPSGSDRSGSSRQLPASCAGSWGGMLSPMERVRNAEQDSSQASSPETATPEVVPTALPNGRGRDSENGAATRSRTPQSELQSGTPASASNAASLAVTLPPVGLDSSATLATPQLTSSTAPAAPDAAPQSLQQLAQMIIRDKETGKEYMIADLGGDADQLSSQKLINLSTNETLVLQYDTLEPEAGSTTARSGSHHARSASSSQMQALGPDAPAATSGRATPREDHGGEDAAPGVAPPTASTSPKSTKKPKSKMVKAWGKQARAWLPTFTNKGGGGNSNTTGISELSVDGGDKQSAAKGGKGGSAHLDAQSADGRVDSETSSPIGSQASESSMMSLTSSKASFIQQQAATTSTADSGPTSAAPLWVQVWEDSTHVERELQLGLNSVQDGVQVMANRKVFREFTSVRIVQQWQAHAGVIWTVSFSDTGAFMATGGKDRIIRVWENKRAPVEAGRAQAPSHNPESRGEAQDPEVFRTPALKELFGHQDDIFDLSWSGNLFLLSASRDKTCMLWHLYSDVALKTFKHDDSVMSVAFHPVDSRHFVSAAWNGKVRLQCANPPRVVDWKQMQLLDALPIHCMRFNSRGDKVSVGSLHGRVRQYRVLPSLKLEHHAEIDVREKSRRRLDVPVTGLDTLAQRPEALLVTTRDSRVRLYNGPLLSVKYKGHRNKSSRIPATLSSDGTFVICGSDDGCTIHSRGPVIAEKCAVVYIWRTDTEASVCLPRKKGCFTPSSGRLKTDSFEAFRAAQCMVTVAVFAPVVPDASLPPPTPFQAPVDPRTSLDTALTSTNGEESAASLRSVAAVQNVLKSFKVDIKTGTKDAVQSARAEGLKLAAFGQVIVVASIDGMIQLFENVGSPKWL